MIIDDDDRQKKNKEPQLNSIITTGVVDLRIYQTPRFQVLSLEPPYTTYHKKNPTEKLSIYLDINCRYTIKIIQQCLQNRNISYTIGPCTGMEITKPPKHTNFQWREYERIEWSTSKSRNSTRTSSYKFRKGLSRKAQLCHYTQKYIFKRPSCQLSTSIPETLILQTWSLFEEEEQPPNDTATTWKSNIIMTWKEKVSLCLADVQRWIRDEEEKYNEITTASSTERIYKKKNYPMWILKPSSANKGEGIRIIQCVEEIQEAILDTTDIREWVLQKYISNPLLLQKRKFHIRAYILAVNALQVYFYNNVLFLRSAIPYKRNPTSTTPSASYLSNTFQQQKEGIDDCVLLQSQVFQILLQDQTCASHHECTQRYNKVVQDMHTITHELFDAYKKERDVFEPLEFSFEQYGLDFMMDDDWNVSLLEVNPGPDFQQTGERCKRVIEGFMCDTIDVALMGNRSGYGTDFDLVFDFDYGACAR